jgi:hypothetical protein
MYLTVSLSDDDLQDIRQFEERFDAYLQSQSLEETLSTKNRLLEVSVRLSSKLELCLKAEEIFAGQSGG